ncbi:hypothetical protein ACCC88_10775 [Sphingomonas sp. Sphisp140]|uniref:hypothetical protein n=1 Tax=unclassified Sphingomonas TaxID=196159 RepID=UPI0039AF6AD9
MILTAFLALAMAPQTLPRQVRAYVARREKCDHFRGEDSPDEARQKEIEAATIRFCTGADRQLARLKRQYAHNRAVQRRLGRYDPRIED